MSNRRGTEPNTTQATNNGSTAQNVNVTDLICEGPIKGLAEGEGSLYLDDVAVEDSKFSDFAPPVSFLNGTITFSGTGVGTISSNVDISSLEFSESSSRSIRLLYKKTKGVTVASDSTNSNNTVRTITLTAASGVSFDSSWETGSQLSGNAEAVVSVSAVGVEPENGVFRVIDSNTAKLITNPSSREFPSAGSYTVVVYYYIPMTSISAATNQVTLATSPASGTYEFSIGTQLQVDDSGEAPASSSSVVKKINNLNIDFRRGDLQQPITSSIGGVGGSVAVAGNTGLVNLPELKIISQAVSTSEGIGIFDKEGLPNSDGSKTYPGFPDYSVMADGATVMPSSAFGLDTAVKIAEADEIGFTIKYPAFQVINLEKGDKETAYAFYVMQIRFQQDGAYTAWKALFPSRGDYVRHFANTNAPISFDHSVNLDGYRNIVGPFENFQVRILRVSRHIGLPVRQTGTNEDDTNKKKWQLSAQASIESLRAVIKDNFIYPYSSIASVSFSSRQFSSIPKRSYLLQGKLVKIPTTYTPREYSSTGIAKYEGFWDGAFHNTPVYTDNPAWVFYDIVTNNRYGAGKWVADNEIDKFALYRIARYCDELVDDGSEYDSTKPLKVGNFYRINTAGTTTWSSVGAASNTVGTIFQATDTTISGTGVAYGVEPRFRANVFLTKATDVYKVLKDFATIFLGILYWQDSKITAVQDAPQDPVYNFTKGNVIDGAFSYESSGSRTRTNQVVVTWNDPTINYEPVPVVVEDRESIVRTGRIISQNAVAFGATSESQAIRYGRWKLWTAQNQTEVVSFKTSLAAHYVKPGDIINVQDADRFGVAYSGRASSATSTTLTFDRNVPFNSGSTYELSTLVTAPAALNASDESVTINSVTYGIGEKVDQGYVHNGSSYVLVNLDTEERASNAFIDSSGSELLPVIWKPYSYVESHQITNPGSTVSTVTLANSATFDTTPSKHNIWTLKETSGGLNVAGSEKMYKILSIGEEAPNIFTISAVEYYIEKFTAIEEEYALGVVPSSIYVQKEPATLARPVNPRVVLATDAGNPGEELILQWDEPDVDSIVQYEVLHNIPELENPLKTDKTQIALNSVPNGSVTFKIRAVSRQGNLSSYTAISYGVYDPYGENVPRMAGGIPKGVISTAQGVIDSNNHFKFQATNTSVASITNPFITYTISGTKNISNISTGEEYYLYLDVATPSLKLLEYNSTALSDMQFYRDVATGNAALSTAWTSIGTVSVAANSNEVTGSGFNTNVKLRDVLNLQNSTSPSGGDGATVISIISDTKLLIDRTFGTAKSSITGYRSAFRPDYANDSIFAEVTKTGSTVSTNNFITLRSSSDDVEGTTETLDNGTIAVKDGGISVDKIAANSITADKIQANTINAREINADAINANHIVAGEITAQAIAADAITADKIAAGAVTADSVAANSVVATLLTATKVQATDIQTTNLSSISANIGDITAGTLKGGNIPDANSAPAGSESGAFLNLTGGKMVFGNASKYVLFDGTNLELNGVIIDASSTVNATAPTELVVKENGTAEVSDAASLNFTSGLNVAVSGTEATISLDTPTDNNFTNALLSKLNGIANNANNYTLPEATTTVLGGVKDGARVTIDGNGVLSADIQSDNNFTTALKNKLNGIESGATADQTAAEIRSLVEAASDSNVFTDTDHTKLNNIEAGATGNQTASEIRALVASASDSNVFTDTDHTKLNGIESGATADQSAAEIRALVESASNSNVFTDTDHTKLNGIASGANAYVLPTNNVTNASVSGSTLTLARQGAGNVTFTDTNTQYSAGSGLGLSGTTFSVDGTVVRTTGSQSIAGNKTFTGDITFSGTTTYINTTTLNVGDNIITLNADFTGSSPTESSGIEIERGTQTNKTFIWKESSDRWSFGSESVEAATFYGSFIGSITGSPSSLAGLSTDDLAEGSTNLYFTNTRARGALSGGTGITYNNTTGAIVNSAPDQTVSLTGSGATSVSGTYPNFTISSTDNNTVPNNATITVNAGTELSTGGAFTTNQNFNETITINHANVSRANNTSSASPGYGASFTAIDSITTNARGHVTAVNTKTVTIPASDNTDNNTVTQIREDSGSYRTGNITLQSGSNVTISEPSAGVFNFAATNTNTTNFNIQASGGASTNISAGETINFTGGGATSVSRSGNTITFTSTDTNTNTNYFLNGISKSGNTLTFSVSGAANQSYTFGSNAFTSTTIPTNNNQLTNGASYITNTGGTTSATASTVVKRTSSADVRARLFRSNYANQASISGAMAFRVNNGSDDYIRFCSDAAAIRNFIGAGTSSTTGTVTSVSGGTGLSGTVTTSGSLNLTNTGVSAATYGNSTNIPQIAVDAQGRITSASNVAVSIPSGANNATITLSAGNGLTGGQSFTTDQSSNETITFNVGAGDGISVAANAVAVDSTVLRAGTGTLINDIINANVITADMIQANSIVATLINADTINANNITTGTLNASNVTISNLRADDITGGVTENYAFADRTASGSTAISGSNSTFSTLLDVTLPAPQFNISKHGYISGTMQLLAQDSSASSSALTVFQIDVRVQKKSRGQGFTNLGTATAVANPGQYLFSVTVSGNYTDTLDFFGGLNATGTGFASPQVEALEYDVTNNKTIITFNASSNPFSVGSTVYYNPDRGTSAGSYLTRIRYVSVVNIVTYGSASTGQSTHIFIEGAKSTQSETYRIAANLDRVNGDYVPTESRYSAGYISFTGSIGYNV